MDRSKPDALLQARDAEAEPGYPTEDLAKAALLQAVNASGLFIAYPETWGHYLALRPGSELKRPRVDFLLRPTQDAEKLGWRNGFVAVEVKMSGTNLGRTAAQAMNYGYACFEPKPGYWVVPRFIFLFPFLPPGYALQSVLVQNRIGFAMVDKWGNLDLNVGGTNILSCWDGVWKCREILCGNKTGSR